MTSVATGPVAGTRPGLRLAVARPADGYRRSEAVRPAAAVRDNAGRSAPRPPRRDPSRRDRSHDQSPALRPTCPPQPGSSCAASATGDRGRDGVAGARAWTDLTRRLTSPAASADRLLRGRQPAYLARSTSRTCLAGVSDVELPSRDSGVRRRAGSLGDAVSPAAGPQSPGGPAPGAPRNEATKEPRAARTARCKKAIIEEYATHPGDTGSPEVQVAMLTKRIKDLTEHLKEHKHDHHFASWPAPPGRSAPPPAAVPRRTSTSPVTAR